MLSTRQKIIIFLGLLVSITLAVLILYFLFNKKPVQPDSLVNESVVNQPKTTQTVSTTTITNPAPVTGEFDEKIYVRQLAVIFVERFASFSNQNNSQNITDVLEMSTKSMADWLNSQRSENSEDYKGVTTEVMSNSLLSFSGAEAEVKFDARQRVEDSSGSQNQQRSGIVTLLKIGNDWKVDGMFWDK